MQLNKFEIIGIGASIGVMALALWLIRIESTTNAVAGLGANSQAAVIVGESGSDTQALREALTEATNGGAAVQRLVIDDVVLGTGEEVTTGDTISVHYIGSLQDGTQFDNSYTRGTPFTFEVGAGRVIQGWDEGVQGMKVGGTRMLVIPSELGYGAAGGGPIPPNSTLVFAVELLEIN